jgi:hypothetical protein
MRQWRLPVQQPYLRLTWIHTGHFHRLRTDHNCVVDVVVWCITRGDVFECQLGDKAYHAWKSWLQSSVISVVHLTKFADECGDDYLRGIEHRLPSCTLLKQSSKILILADPRVFREIPLVP